MKKIVFLLLSLLSFQLIQAQDKEYVQSVNQWHQMRIDYLKKPDGWLNLEGLFWLHKGRNSFGSNSMVDCHYDNKDFPALLGSFIYEGDSVIWENGKTDAIEIDHVKAALGKSYNVFDEKGKESLMDWKQFSWVVIKREDKVGIRFRNLKAKSLLNWKPKWSLEVALIKTNDWYKVWKNGNDMLHFSQKQISEYMEHNKS